MGHGKETPRQKMIGMMYLVLTALLALNVAAEVLNAFVIVDKALNKTSSNFQSKNEEVYSKFLAAYEENKAKVGKWKDKADKLKTTSQAIMDTIHGIKKQIISIADKIPEEAWHDSLLFNIQKKDDNNVPGQVMILWGRGDRLKEMIIEYRAEVISLIEDTVKYHGLVEMIKSNLNTDDIIDVEGKPKDWSEAYFNHLPLAGVTTILSKIQADVRNTEADMLTYLFAQIDAGSFKFNKLEAIVKAPTSYVLQNNKYQAEVFIAASDTTVVPEIFVGGKPLPIKDGKGIYTGGTGSVGPKNWGGVIKYKGPDGNILEYPFKAMYEVGAPSLVVSPTKMNVFYIGVDNPVSVSVSGVAEKDITPYINGFGGKIKKAPTGGYIVTVTKPTLKNQYVYVGAKASFDGATKDMGKQPFRVKRVPDPTAMVGRDPKNQKGGIIKKTELMSQSGIRAELENFDFDLRFDIVSFTVSASIGGYEESQAGTGPRFSPRQVALMKKVDRGKKVYIEDIVARGPDKKPIKLQALVFKLN